VTTSAEIELDTVVVTPGGEASTTVTIRNDGDIVEGYELEVVGECAAWSTVQPARVSLYPGTSQEVTVRLAPPRSPEVRAGRVPLGVRVLPVERPDAVVVPETTVLVEPFGQLQAQLVPQRRRGWLGARYRVSVRNLGNAPTDVLLSSSQAGEDLRFALTPDRSRLEPGTELDGRLRVRVGTRIWFGKPVTWPFEVHAVGAEESAEEDPAARTAPLPGELVQLPILPRWLLALLALLLALLIAWFALLRPAVRSTAEQAAEDKAVEVADEREAQAAEPGAGSITGPGDGNGTGSGEGTGEGTGEQGTGEGSGNGTGNGSGNGTAGALGEQSSATIEVRTGGGTRNVGTYAVPSGKIFLITDVVVANFQGDEGVVTISFGDRTITTIALETFRNQDYHWVTPIEVPENALVTADVTCVRPGTPASGQQASGCAQLLNVSGALRDVRR
jgi:hypothetical protein